MPVTVTTGTTAQDSGQADRFSAAFNPAFGFVVDAIADYVDSDSEDDGLNASLRVLELASQAWVDPNAWAYFIAAADEESLNIEEAAIHYVGLGSQTTLRAGRFFIDFGKQMQGHVHELRTLERPLALRAYLGDEVKGDGLQYDQWASIGESTVLRWSLAAFANLLPEETALPTAPVEAAIDERKDFGNFNFTGRVTAFTDVGKNGVLQLGASMRAIPDFAVDDPADGLSLDQLSNQVWGVDLTYGWTDSTGLRTWTLGGEALLSTGDSGFTLIDPDGIPGSLDETLSVNDEPVFGSYVFADYAWTQFRSVGAQFSTVELANADGSRLSEIELYTTRRLSEFQRLRLGASWTHDDGTDEDAYRVALQYSATLGSHGHGVNW